MARKNAVQHGTPQGYKKHFRDPEWGDPCDSCRAAHNLEVTLYRGRKGRDRTSEQSRRTAVSRARTRLAQLYPQEYTALLNEELDKTEASR